MTPRKLKILTYRWHVGHQYELWKLGHEFTLLTGTGTAMCEEWDYNQRPLPKNAAFKPLVEIDPREFDLAILHFDENVLHPELCNGRETPDWGETFRKMLVLTQDLPRIAICHGTPQFKGQYEPDFKPDGPVQVYEDSRRELVNLLADVVVVCNSFQAEREWAFKRSTTIWHGMSPYEYAFGAHDKDGLAPQFTSLAKRGHYMGFLELKEFMEKLRGILKVDYPDPADPALPNANLQEWAIAKYANYRKMVGEYTFYLNTTLRSPMPRSRAEAMFCGGIPLTYNNHDTELFIKNGENGYASNDAAELVDFVLYLQRHPAQKEKMALAARESAIKHFHIDRFLEEWGKLIQSTL